MCFYQTHFYFLFLLVLIILPSIKTLVVFMLSNLKGFNGAEGHLILEVNYKKTRNQECLYLSIFNIFPQCIELINQFSSHMVHKSIFGNLGPSLNFQKKSPLSKRIIKMERSEL